MRKIRFCTECDRYTLEQNCPICSKQTVINSPQRYSKDEEISKYRREIKKKILKENGIV